jgi:hypothetical protein
MGEREALGEPLGHLYEILNLLTKLVGGVDFIPKIYHVPPPSRGASLRTNIFFRSFAGPLNA